MHPPHDASPTARSACTRTTSSAALIRCGGHTPRRFPQPLIGVGTGDCYDLSVIDDFSYDGFDKLRDKVRMGNSLLTVAALLLAGSAVCAGVATVAGAGEVRDTSGAFGAAAVGGLGVASGLLAFSAVEPLRSGDLSTIYRATFRGALAFALALLLAAAFGAAGFSGYFFANSMFRGALAETIFLSGPAVVAFAPGLLGLLGNLALRREVAARSVPKSDSPHTPNP